MINRYINAIAGAFILISLALAHYLNPNWLWFTAFVGANFISVSLYKLVLNGYYFKKTGG